MNTFTPSKDINAYREGWEFSHVIPAGQEVKVIDTITDERGWCLVIIDKGDEYLLDGGDIDEKNSLLQVYVDAQIAEGIT